MSVVELDEVRRRTIDPSHFKDLAVPVRGLDRVPPDDDAVSCDCFHGDHLYLY